MTNPTNNGAEGLEDAFHTLRMPEGFLPSWAAPFVGRSFGIGSEDGQIMLLSEKGSIISRPQTFIKGTITGLSVAGFWIGVSTPEMVGFLPWHPENAEKEEKAFLPHGAHDISTSPSGYLIASFGRAGVMTVAPPFTRGMDVIVYGPPPELEGYYFYRSNCFVGPDNKEVLVSATRKGGIVSTRFEHGADANTLQGLTYDGFDAIDFCQLRPGEKDLAMAVLGADGSVILTRDVATDKSPQRRVFQSIKGTAYRVLCCLGDIYVLTSFGLFMLSGLAERFLRGELGDGIDTQILVLPMEGVDANLCGSEWLLVVRPDDVLRLDVRKLHAAKPETVHADHMRQSHSRIEPTEWKRDSVRQRGEVYAGS